MGVKDYPEMLARPGGVNNDGEICDTLQQALRDATVENPSDLVVALGSFFIMAEVRSALGINADKDGDILSNSGHRDVQVRSPGGGLDPCPVFGVRCSTETRHCLRKSFSCRPWDHHHYSRRPSCPVKTKRIRFFYEGCCVRTMCFLNLLMVFDLTKCIILILLSYLLALAFVWPIHS